MYDASEILLSGLDCPILTDRMHSTFSDMVVKDHILPPPRIIGMHTTIQVSVSNGVFGKPRIKGISPVYVTVFKGKKGVNRIFNISLTIKRHYFCRFKTD